MANYDKVAPADASRTVICDVAQFGSNYQVLLGVACIKDGVGSGEGLLVNAVPSLILSSVCQWSMLYYLFKESAGEKGSAEIFVMFSGIVVWLFACMQDITGCLVREVYLVSSSASWSAGYKRFGWFLVLTEVLLLAALCIIGVLLIRSSNTASDVVLNCTALKFLSEVDELLLKFLQNLGDPVRDCKYNTVPGWTQAPWDEEQSAFAFGTSGGYGCLLTVLGIFPIVPIAVAIAAAHI